MIFALDTNMISYILRRNVHVYDRYVFELRQGNECVIPPVAYYEIRRGLLAINATAKQQEFAELCRDFEVGRMSVAAWEKSAQLYAARRGAGQTTEDADLFIAAFSIVNGYTLVTNNAKHFQNMDGLNLVNWADS